MFRDVLHDVGLSGEAGSLHLSTLWCMGGHRRRRKGPQSPSSKRLPVKPVHWTDTPPGYEDEVSEAPGKSCTTARQSTEHGMKDLSGGCVFVHVYDWGRSGFTSLLNSYITKLGAFHSGVEIYGSEWCFGGTLDSISTGIVRIPPRSNKEHVYRTTIPMGVTQLTPAQVEIAMEVLQREWRGHTYDMFTRNCNHFSDALCCVLGCSHLPSWIFGPLQAQPAAPREWTEEPGIAVPAERQPLQSDKRGAVQYGEVPLGVRPCVSAAIEAGIGDYGVAIIISAKLSDTQVTKVLQHLEGISESYNILSWNGNYFSDAVNGLLGWGSAPADTLSKLVGQGQAPSWIFKALSCSADNNALLRELTDESMLSEQVPVSAMCMCGDAPEACCETAVHYADPTKTSTWKSFLSAEPRTPKRHSRRFDMHRAPLAVLDDNVQHPLTSENIKLFEDQTVDLGFTNNGGLDFSTPDFGQHKHYHGPEASPEAWMSYRGLDGRTFWHRRNSGRPPWQTENNPEPQLGAFPEHLRREANGELCLLRWEDTLDMDDL